MRILFDHGAPSGIGGLLSGHDVAEVIERGWDRISNGELLQEAEAAGFDRRSVPSYAKSILFSYVQSRNVIENK